MKPYLRDEIPKIPDVPSYDAGYLVTKNASWRSEKPVVCSENVQAVFSVIFTVRTELFQRIKRITK